MQGTEAKIYGFANLPPGWHYGSGRAPSAEAIARAVLIFRTYQYLGFSKTNAFPGIDGEIMVTTYEGDHYFETTLEAEGTVRFAYEFPGEDNVYIENMLYYQVFENLFATARKIKSEPWRSSGLSIQATTSTPTGGSSKISPSAPSGTQPEAWAFPASTLTVQFNVAEAFVITSSNTIKHWPQNPPYIGYLRQTNFQQEAA